MTTRLSRSLALLLLVLLASACETATDPIDGDAFQATLEQYQALDAALASPALAGFRALGGRTPYGASRSIDLLSALVHDAPAQAAAAASGAALAPIISETHRGKTFIYDAAQDRYVLSQRSGAPATGVRFIVYEVDAAGRPIVGRETGYADLIDEGDGSDRDVALRLKVVRGSETVLDYRTTLDDGPTQGLLAVHGFLIGDNDVEVEFDVDATGRKQLNGGELDIDFEIAIDQRDFSITGQLRGARAGVEGEGEIDVTVRHRDHSIRLDAEGASGQIDASFFVDGELFATAEGSAQSPTVLGRDGQPITGVEALVLLRIWDSLEDVFDLLEDLIDPVDDIVFWGIAL